MIVDNTPSCYSYHKENGIPIVTWFDDPSDKELKKLLSILKLLSKVYDVREYIKESVIDDFFDKDKCFNLIENHPRYQNSSQLSD